LHPDKTEAEIDSLLATIVKSMENLETYRARARHSKPQWPGAVTLETPGAGKPILHFMSWPEAVCQFEERFKIVKAWAETHLTNEAAEVLETGGKTAKPPKAVESRPPLSPNAAFVLDMLKALPPGRALTGPKILDALAEREPPLFLDESVLTSQIMPFLKEHYGVKNKPRIGYYVPA